jgi:hypothetical protein
VADSLTMSDKQKKKKKSEKRERQKASRSSSSQEDPQHESSQNTETKNERDEPIHDWRNVVAGAFHDLSRWSWIPNLVVGVAFLFICIGAALFVKTERGGFICIAVGLTIIFWIIVIAIYFRLGSPNSQPLQFSVEQEGGISSVDRTIGARYCLAYRRIDEIAAVPITDLIYVRFTNMETVPMMVSYYAVDVRKPNGKWESATCLNGLNGKLFFRRSAKEGREIMLDDPRFDVATRNVNIPPNGGAVKGWILVERPAGFDGTPDTRQWRLRARDANGKEGYGIISVAATDKQFDVNESLSGLSGVGFKLGGFEDIGDFQVTFYSDFLKH